MNPRSSTPLSALGLLYAGLLVVSAGSTVAGIRWPDSAFGNRFAPNLATEAMSVLVTIAVVRRLLDRQERAQRLRGSVGALRRSGRALAGLVDTWARLVKASRPFAEPVPGTCDDLLAPYRTEDLMFLDPSGQARGEDAPFTEGAAERLAGCRGDLRDVIAVYSADLEPEYKEMLDAVTDDPFLDLVLELARRGVGQREWRVAVNSVRGHREAHFARLLGAVQLHNRFAAEAARYRSRTAAPHSDVTGIVRPLDHDTRVDLELPRRWWREAPGAGSLDSRR